MLLSERLAEAVALRLRRAQLDAKKQELAGQIAQIDSALNQVTTELSAHDAAIESILAKKGKK